MSPIVMVWLIGIPIMAGWMLDDYKGDDDDSFMLWGFGSIFWPATLLLELGSWMRGLKK